jgi:hypothetical protein
VAAQLEGDWMLHGVPIVFITALITPKETRDSRRINGHRVIPKPTQGFDLIKVIEENLPCCADVCGIFRKWRDLESVAQKRE